MYLYSSYGHYWGLGCQLVWCSNHVNNGDIFLFLAVDIEGHAAKLFRVVSQGGSLPSPFPVSPVSSHGDIKEPVIIPEFPAASTIFEDFEACHRSNESLASSLCANDSHFADDDREGSCGAGPEDGAGEAMATPRHKIGHSPKPPNVHSLRTLFHLSSIYIEVD